MTGRGIHIAANRWILVSAAFPSPPSRQGAGACSENPSEIRACSIFFRQPGRRLFSSAAHDGLLFPRYSRAMSSAKPPASLSRVRV